MRDLSPTAKQALGVVVDSLQPKSVRDLAGDLNIGVGAARSACNVLERRKLVEATYLWVGNRPVRHFVATWSGTLFASSIPEEGSGA